MEEHKLNRLKTGEWVRKASDEYWEHLRTAHERGEKVAWVIASGNLLTQAMGMPTLHHANYSAWIGAKHLSKELFEACEVEGHFPDNCSYHRATSHLPSLGEFSPLVCFSG